MTVIITISCSEGIVCGGDRLITGLVNGTLIPIRSKRKVIPLKDKGICISYWGLATINQKSIEKHINHIINQMSSNNFNIDTFSKRLKEYFSQFEINNEMGLHIAGFSDNRPQIRHLFHLEAHKDKEEKFTLENTNLEQHDPTTLHRIPHNRRISYLALFNGDNILVNGLLRYPSLVTNGRWSIAYDKLSLKEAQRLILLLIANTINMQKYVNIYQNRGRTCGNGIDIFSIQPDNKIIQLSNEEKQICLDLL